MRAKKLLTKAWRALAGSGQSLVEYSLILVLITIVVLVLLTFVGQTRIVGMYSKISSTMVVVGH